MGFRLSLFCERAVRALFAAFALALPLGALAQSMGPAAPLETRDPVLGGFVLAAPLRAPVHLEAPEPELHDALRKRNGEPGNKALIAGLGRELPASMPLKAAELHWTAADGGFAAQWEVRSPGASALRVALAIARMGPGVELRFGPPEGPAYGPFRVDDVLLSHGLYWSPVIEGDRAVIEVFAPHASGRGQAQVALVRLSHLFASPTDPYALQLAKLGNLGDSGACNVDLICRSATDAPLAEVGRGVARITSTNSEGRTGYCTGTLLSNPNRLPYMYSAAHCIDDQTEANTVTSHWTFDRTGCGTGGVSSAWRQVSGGAVINYRSASSDVLLMRMNQPPPSSAMLIGWDAATLALNTALVGVHHPAGDVKKVSLGRMAGFAAYGGSPPNDRLDVTWNGVATGITEGGSSGSGIFTSSSTAGYQLRGGLHGGPSSCFATGSSLRDYYSRLDLAFPSLREFLQGTTTAANNTGLWWNAAESGWGINFNQQGEILFATLFNYDAEGVGLWLVMSEGRLQPNGSFSGALYRTTGPVFNAVPFRPITAANLTQVGTMTVSFASASSATLSYTVNGIPVSKAITRQVFGSRAANCSGASGSRAGLTNYQDLWWNAAESGWGLNLTHQDNTLFGTLFTYRSDGNGMWLVMDAGTRQSDGSYQGNLYRTTGPAFNANPFRPITAANLTQVGTMRLAFSNGENASLTYTVNGATVNKQITRQVFGSQAPSCN